MIMGGVVLVYALRQTVRIKKSLMLIVMIPSFALLAYYIREYLGYAPQVHKPEPLFGTIISLVVLLPIGLYFVLFYREPKPTTIKNA